MKKNRIALYATVVAFFLTAGCSTKIGQALNPFHTVNQVDEVVSAETNAVTGEILVSTNYVTNVVTSVRPGWEKAISGAKAANASLNPTPTAPFVNIGLTALSSLLAIGATWANKRRKREAGMVNTLIAGVEMAGDAQTKAQIKLLANQFKQARELHERVKKQTNADI